MDSSFPGSHPSMAGIFCSMLLPYLKQMISSFKFNDERILLIPLLFPLFPHFLLYQSSIQTTCLANSMHAFEVLARGNTSHNLEVVSTPQTTTITLFLAVSIFSQSRLGVYKRPLLLPWSVLLSHCNMPFMSSSSFQTSTTSSLSWLWAPTVLFTSWLAFSVLLHPFTSWVSTSFDGCHSIHSLTFVS